MESVVGRTLSVHQEHEFLQKLEAVGLNSELAQRIIESGGNELAIMVIELIQTRGFTPTASQSRAREIMKENFFGIEDAIRYFGINPSDDQTTALSEIPFSETVLEALKDTHVLMIVFPFSISDLRRKMDSTLPNLFNDQSWYGDESFIKEHGDKASWQLVRKTPVPDSISRNWSEQQGLIVGNEEVPTARIMVYTIISHFLTTNKRLFKDFYVRTSSVASDNHRRVIVGLFNSQGLNVGWSLHDDQDNSLGISSARKL